MEEYITKNDIIEFCRKLEFLTPSVISKERYPQEYLANLLSHKKYFVKIYAGVLNHLISSSEKAKQNITLVDYGAGNGLLGLFAKFCNFGRVVLVDFAPTFIQAAKTSAKILNIPVDFFVEGTLTDLDLETVGIPDAIVGTDVIEHIYNLDTFFSLAKEINPQIILVFTTASNDKNWLKRFHLKQLQRTDEYRGWPEGSLNGKYPSFREIRKQIILAEIPSLIVDPILNTLVTRTRGLAKEDIIVACKKFKENGELPREINHPSNTCDPITGSWTERLLSFKEYHNLYRKNAFQLGIYKGFYNSDTTILKGYLCSLANLFIKHSGAVGFRLSPFIFLKGM